MTIVDDRPNTAAQSWALVERFQAGDGTAFDAIYRQYRDTVFRFVHYRVSSRHTAEDLTAEVFVRAFNRLGTFTWQGRDLAAWLLTIARNLVADHYKSGRMRLEVSVGELLGDYERADRQPEGDPAEAAVGHLTNLALLAAVNRLNPLQRQVIVLRFLRGLSMAEAAEVMGKNEPCVKSLQYRAVRTLQRLLPDWAEEVA